MFFQRDRERCGLALGNAKAEFLPNALREQRMDKDLVSINPVRTPNIGKVRRVRMMSRPADSAPIGGEIGRESSHLLNPRDIDLANASKGPAQCAL